MHGGHELPGPSGTAAQAFVFAHGSSHQVPVDAIERPEQLRALEAPVVVDPASHDQVDRLSEVSQGRPALQVQ